MEKIREIKYKACDECEKESPYVYKCSLCGTELCTKCCNESPMGNYFFCSVCFTDKLKDEYLKFYREWKELKEKQDKESEGIADKFTVSINEIIRLEKSVALS